MNRALLSLPILLLSLLSLPQTASDQIRAKAVASLRPFYKIANHPSDSSLALENHQLRAQLDLVYEWAEANKWFSDEGEKLLSMKKEEGSSKPFLDRRMKELKNILQAQTKALFGSVVYRDPGSWSSCCWINVGEENNKTYGETIVAKNSPVIAGSCLIGVVEYVGQKESRVRLISDSGLKTAVRAIRGSIQERELASLTHQLLLCLKKHPQLKLDPVVSLIAQLEQRLVASWQDLYLAKGEIQGSSAPYFRTLKSDLKGLGFNCDFPDEEGAARDLRSGSIIQAGDVLVTSGLDGLFPPGLKVGIVKEVSPLQEGAFAYELTATPAAGNLADFSSVFVLPSLNSE